ncbi:rhomboid family intramembrane serine protease [Sulfuriroseicoccus oceanibius]|uniref:Rhomboid family intramembrane serine protease n=1 Tax=Sulfuriroseicoccus oceanibius TaxID=2707525 RepID=A0A6B3LA27_9BACT|nr:rhomboid family intramembrane serine protease [Sulfuriroseicoccus oceanibius]QQL44755.1 rhomboid family intramembrane serine protease [Sulfuriroseicoccus oceanibius]
MNRPSHHSPAHPMRWRGPLPTERPQDDMVRRLAIINCIVFAFVNVLQNPLNGHLLMSKYWLTADSLAAGQWWRLVTHMFLHGGTMHLVANMLALYSFGRVVEDELGGVRTLIIYFAGGIAGGLLQCGLANELPLVGASGGVFAVVMAFCWMRWNLKVTLLLGFVIPLHLKGRTFTYGLLGASLVLGWWYSGDVSSVMGQIGHWAHLGGGLMGLALGRFFFGPAIKPFFPVRWGGGDIEG